MGLLPDWYSAVMLLPDSQVALRLVDDNPRLGIAARGCIENDDVVHVSAATIWELTVKSMLGKLAVEPEFEKLLVNQGITLLPITAQHAAGIAQFPELLRHDPIDRLLIAQARLERLACSAAAGRAGRNNLTARPIRRGRCQRGPSQHLTARIGTQSPAR